MNKKELITELQGLDHDCKRIEKGFCKYCDKVELMDIEELEEEYNKVQDIRDDHVHGDEPELPGDSAEDFGVTPENEGEKNEEVIL